jgi:hypothetical protein
VCPPLQPANQHGHHVLRSERASRRGRCASIHRRRRRGDGDSLQRRRCGDGDAIAHRSTSLAETCPALPLSSTVATAAPLAETGPSLPLSPPVAATAALAETGPSLPLSPPIASAAPLVETGPALPLSSSVAAAASLPALSSPIAAAALLPAASSPVAAAASLAEIGPALPLSVATAAPLAETCPSLPLSPPAAAAASLAETGPSLPLSSTVATAAFLAETGPALPLSSPVAGATSLPAPLSPVAGATSLPASSSPVTAAASLPETGPARPLSTPVAHVTSCSVKGPALPFPSVASPTASGAHIVVGVSASASDVDKFGALLRADELAYVAELYAADGRLPRATATGGVYAAISEEEDDGDGMRDEMTARWVRILGRIRVRETSTRSADVRQGRDPPTAVRAIRSLAAPTPVRFSSPEESAAYIPFKGVPARGRGPAPFTPLPRATGAGT